MKLVALMPPESPIPESFVLPTNILARPLGSMTVEAKNQLMDRIELATKQAVGLDPACVRYVGWPFVAFGEGGWSQKTWFQGDQETGVFKRIDPPTFNPELVIPAR